MKGQTEERELEIQHPQNLLLDLPGPVWRTLWSSLQAVDRLRLFQSCRGLRDRTISICQNLGFTATSEASQSQGSLSLLQAALGRPQPLKRLSLGAAGSVEYAARAREQLGTVLQEWLEGAVHALPQQRPTAPGLRELVLQNVCITAGTAALLPQAFPQLSVLQLQDCELDTAALLTALRSCQHLTSLALEEPQHMDPAGLWEAGLAEAEAAGIPDVLRREVGLASHPASEDVHRADAECAAAMGLLLCRLPHLTALSLSMPCVPAALKLLLQGGAKDRLQAVKLHDSASYCQPRDGGGMDWLAAGPNSHDNRISEASLSLSHKFTLPALLACTSLTSLELSTKLAYRVLATLVQSANMRALRSLRLPTQIVCQGLLDIMLKDLPELEHLAVGSFRGLSKCRADAPCRWRSLQLCDPDVQVTALAHLPLHSLDQGLQLASRAIELSFYGSEYGAAMHPPGGEGRAAALAEAACTNLARLKPGLISSPHGELEVFVAGPYASPHALKLLRFFPKLGRVIVFGVRLGAEMLDGLRQGGSALTCVRYLELGVNLQPDMWSPGLWAVLPALRELKLYGAALDTSPAAIDAMMACCAVAPRPVTVLLEGNMRLQQVLQARLVQLPSCQVKFVFK